MLQVLGITVLIPLSYRGVRHNPICNVANMAFNLDDMCAEMAAAQAETETVSEDWKQQGFKGELSLRRSFGPISINKLDPYNVLASIVANPPPDEPSFRERVATVRLSLPCCS